MAWLCPLPLPRIALGLASLLSSSSPPSLPAVSPRLPRDGVEAVIVPCHAPPSVPSLRFVAVGQGAALVIDGGGDDVVLIDSGPPSGAEAILAALEVAGVHAVALWIHTHFDADHVGGVTRVLAGLDGVEGTLDDLTVAGAWDRGDDALPSTDVVAAYFTSRLAHVRRAANDGDVWSTDTLTLRALRVAPDLPTAEENTRGLAVCVDLGPLRLLALGDLPSTHAEQVAMACPDVDVLWVAHHGAADAVSTTLLEITSPTLAVVSAGNDNVYCHPAPITTARLAGIPSAFTGVAATDPAAACGDLAARWQPGHVWMAADVCVVPS